MDVSLYQQPFDKALGNLYVRDYIEVFPYKKEDVSLDCIDCFMRAYSRLVYYLKKTNMKKFSHSLVKGKEYNFPKLGIYGLTSETITDAIAQKLYDVKSPFVKLAKEDK